MTKKVEKDIETVVHFVDDDNSMKITYHGLGYILNFLDVFKIAFAEEKPVEPKLYKSLIKKRNVGRKE